MSNFILGVVATLAVEAVIIGYLAWPKIKSFLGIGSSSLGG